ncbi:DUF4190 domain-containing protein [Streptomyces albogriseolus]|uniref:DUF4190 domain-containing protein n=1 Tax=Streptomyces albogriseolus TaxID=1887 RepID=UPI00378ABBAD
MSDDAPAPGAGDRTGDGTPPAGSSTPELWPAPADGGAPHVAPLDGSLVDARTTETGRAAPGTRDAETPAADPWALPGDHAQASGGPGETVVAGETTPWSPPTVHDRPASGASTVHDQQTVTSFPAASDATPPPPAYGGAWAGPAGTAAPVPQPAARPAAADPFAPPAAGAAVPPPPIGPEGPGQVPYGYPHAGYAGAPAQGYPGWAGVPPLPSNGMGVASLVLGIIAAAAFCLWPVAIVLGVLAVIFGAIGRGKANRGEATNGGQALAGVICGAVGSALALTFGVIVLVT